MMSRQLTIETPSPPNSHDLRSPQSQQALALLRQAQRGGDGGSSSSTPSNSNEGNGAIFLKEASSPASSSLDLQLEIKERAKEPPTPGQLRTILEYLKASPPPPPTAAAANFSVEGAPATTRSTPENHPAAVGGAGIGARPQTKRPTNPPPGVTRTRVKNTLEDDDSAASSESAVSRHLESSPLLLVDWDAGRASTDLAGVQEMIERWREEQASGKQGGQASKSDAGGNCVVM